MGGWGREVKGQEERVWEVVWFTCSLCPFLYTKFLVEIKDGERESEMTGEQGCVGWNAGGVRAREGTCGERRGGDF